MHQQILKDFIYASPAVANQDLAGRRLRKLNLTTVNILKLASPPN